MEGGREGELKGRRKSILNISFQSNVNNLCCLCFLLLLFIYLLLSFQLPARFSKASWTGKLYQTFEFSFKRLSPRLFIYFFFFTLVLLLFGEANIWSFDEKQTWHVFFSDWPQGNLNKLLNIVCTTLCVRAALIKRISLLYSFIYPTTAGQMSNNHIPP